MANNQLVLRNNNRELVLRQIEQLRDEDGVSDEELTLLNIMINAIQIQEQQVQSLTEGFNALLKKFDEKEKTESARKTKIVAGTVAGGCIGAGAGAAVGAKYGASLGAVAGPAGAIVGALAGGAVCGLATASLTK
ncbi:unnamed protein product [Meloidogyne enterolobii]|uniref:Uncharacterized protein n=2 Tax=Meloidogyne enterolobii TaxID=390850 RepID=A0ACB0ZHE6_MELEN|nr:unnamed protein product [Meloidogyne enterolobii]